MKRIALSLAAGLGLLALVPTAAMAHTDLSVGLNLGGGYYAPQPTYVETYVAPPPVYYRAEPDYDGYGRESYLRERDRHYRMHNDWVRHHPGQGAHYAEPPR
jgi:hypothetical protein